MKHAQWIAWSVLVGASVLAAAACNSLTGLDDYEKVDCVGVCGDAGSSDAKSEKLPDVVDDVVPDVEIDVRDGGPDADVFVESGLDADADGDADGSPLDAPDDVTYDASEVGSIDRTLRWARWRMPHANVTPVPDADAAPGPTQSSGYTHVDAGFDYFEDNTTELRWTSSHTAPLTFGDAVTHCSKDSDPPRRVRLPTRIELVSLLEPTMDPPYSGGLTDVQAGRYWTMSNVPNRDQSPDVDYWVVDFESGAVSTLTGDGLQEAYVRCVIDYP